MHQQHSPEKIRYPFMGGWVGPKAGLDGCEKISPQPGFDPRIINIYIYTEWPKKCIRSLLINNFGMNLNEISISGWECNIMYNSKTSLISIFLLYKYSSYGYRVIFFMSKCVYIFFWATLYIMQCCYPCHEGIPREQINSYSFLSLAGPRPLYRWQTNPVLIENETG